MKNFLFLALISLSSNGFAHDFSSRLSNDISSTDYINISCDNLTDKIHIEISGNKSADAPIISAQIFKDSKAKNITTQGASRVDFQGGGGAYNMTINKNKIGEVNYTLVYHCEDANGDHTETDLNELQNQ
ncbi:MAG: hypothetical protein RLZZ66_425 [Pseudomonadota bacterium]|jgi:hypothetical protein